MERTAIASTVRNGHELAGLDVEEPQRGRRAVALQRRCGNLPRAVERPFRCPGGRGLLAALGDRRVSVRAMVDHALNRCLGVSWASEPIGGANSGRLYLLGSPSPPSRLPAVGRRWEPVLREAL